MFVYRYAGHTHRQNLLMRSLDPARTYHLRDEQSGQTTVYTSRTLLSQGLAVELQPNSGRVYSYDSR
ncbi:MAG: hypothetical protein HY326_09320 [Chloroflexi bacterium]|nr:hypothetical protein [Chloroflexota bacterium]